MMVPFTKKEILPTFLPVFFRMVRLTISVPPLEILLRSAKPIPKPMTTPPKRALMMGSSVKVTNWHKLDKEGTHGYCDKGKDCELMPNLIPSQDHQRKINGIESQRNRNVKTKPVITQGRDNLCQTCRTTRIYMPWLEKEIAATADKKPRPERPKSSRHTSHERCFVRHVKFLSDEQSGADNSATA